jgi:glycosyltransferase involved in cell wall biosynthesis
MLGFASEWISALAQRLEFVHVITMRGGRIEVPGNVRVYSVGKEKGYSEPRRALEFYRLLLRVLREDRIDACFSHMAHIFVVLAAPVLRRKAIPIVTWHAHRQVTPTLRLAHVFSDRIVSSAKNSYHYNHDKLSIVGQGIGPELFLPHAIPAEIPPLLLSVGRMSPIKDTLTLVEAVHLLHGRGYNVHCALVGGAPNGDDAYEVAVRQRVQALGLEGSLQFIGPVPYRQVAPWYRRSFAHVNCSPPDHSLDKAVLEAMACGKASLSSTQGFRETMGAWADVLLFEHANPHDLATKLEWLLQSRDHERQTLGMSLRASVLKRHGLDRLADTLLALFSSLTNDRRSVIQ